MVCDIDGLTEGSLRGLLDQAQGAARRARSRALSASLADFRSWMSSSEAPAVRAELPQAPEVSKAPAVRFLPKPQAPSPSAATSPEAGGSKAPPAVRLLPMPQGLGALAPPPAPPAGDRARISLGASSKATPGSASHCPPRALLPPPVRFAGVSVDDLFSPIDISKYRGAPKPVAVSEASRNLAQAIAKFSAFKAPSSITTQA